MRSYVKGLASAGGNGAVGALDLGDGMPGLAPGTTHPGALVASAHGVVAVSLEGGGASKAGTPGAAHSAAPTCLGLPPCRPPIALIKWPLRAKSSPGFFQTIDVIVSICTQLLSALELVARS